MHVQDGEEPELSLSSVGKTERICWRRCRKFKVNKIVSIAVNSKSTMVNLQAQGYKIIDSNILQSMLDEVGR